MSNYTPKVGGYQWRQALVELRQDKDFLLQLVVRLGRAAQSDKTKIALLEGQVACYRMGQRLDELMRMEEKNAQQEE